MNTSIASTIELSGRSLTSRQAFALINPAPAVRPTGRAAVCLQPARAGEEVEGVSPPQAGDLRLMATLDAPSRKPSTSGASAQLCSGVLQASFFDGTAWHRFDLPSLVNTHSFKDATELEAAIRWARAAAADAAGRMCERRVIDKSPFHRYSLTPQTRAHAACQATATGAHDASN